MIGDNELAIFNESVALLKSIDGIKRVEMFNNQIQKEDQSDVGLYPAIFIEMHSGNFQDLGGDAGIQLYDCTVTLHVAFEQYKDNSKDVLLLKQKVFATYHRFEPKTVNTVGRFLRYGDEEKNDDHDNLEDYIQIYLCRNVKEYDAFNPASTPVTLITPITTTIVTNIT